VAIGIFFYQQDRKKKKQEELHDMIRRFCKTILNDITAIKKYLEDYPKKEIKVKQKDKEDKKQKNREYTELFISTKVYESPIYSGLFTHFET
jgi:hypothetical protein